MINDRVLFYANLCLVIGLTIGITMYHRSVEANRERQLHLATQSLGSLPRHFGDWHLEGAAPLSKSVEDLLQCSAYLNHTYRNQRNGAVVGLVLLVGPAGPLVAHTPQVCMATQQYEPLGESIPFVLAIGGKEQQFLEARFRAKALDGSDVAIYYGWSRDGADWQAPSQPRLKLGPSPFLYKIQVVSPELTSSRKESEITSRAFLEAFIPVFRESMIESETVTTKFES
jgi:hypothetical protein